MHSSGSIIKTFCEKVRHYLDDPDIDAKYDDNYLVRFFLSSSMTDVIGRVSMMADNQIICMLTISVVNGTTYYKLPPSIKQVLRIGVQDPNTGWFVEDFKPRNEFSLFGPGWALEGNLLAFRPAPSAAKNYLVLYVPSGDISAHYAATSGSLGTLNANGTFTLSSAPTIGSIDKRDNAYAGSYIRIFGPNLTDELIITSHDAATRVITLRNPPVNAADTYAYEVIPFLMEPMTDAIAISAAMRAGVGRKINQVTMQNLALAYKQAIKTAHDTIGNMNSRLGKKFDKVPDPVGGYTIGSGGSAATTGTCAPCGPAGGDLAGSYPNPTVDGLQGRPVASTAPTTNQVLAWNGTSWAPSAAGSGSGTVTSITPAADTGTGTAITTSGSITVAGTANEVETSVSGTTVTVGLPSAITVTEVNVDLVDFNTGASAPAAQPGREYWDSTWETISLGLDANVSLKHGQQIYIRGHNSTGTQIDRGKVVHLAGGHATTEALIELADADTENASSRTVGIAAENIGHGATGFVQVFGYISGLATNGYTGVEGSALYLSSTAGDMSSTLPTQPKHGLRVGFIVKKAGGGSGSIFINIQNYQELDELSDVLISGQAEQDLLSWDNTAGVWKNRTIAAAGVAAATHTHAAADIASGTIATARLGSGTASNATFLRGDQTWATVSGGGVADADYGDITVSGTGAVWTIDPGVVGTSKLGGDITTAGKALLDDADAAAQRTTLGAAAATHTHAAGDITSGTLAVARGGTNLGTTPSNGQLLIGNGTGYTLATLTQGSNVTITNSSGAITIGATGGSAFNPATKVEVYSDFLGNNTIPWAPSTSGGSVTFTQAGGLSNPGAANMGTGTAALGRSAVGSQLQNAISLGNGTVTFSAAHFIQGNLSNSTETYVEELGFLDSVSGVFQYAVYFTYTDSLNGGRWQCICSDGLGITSVDSGVAAVADVYIRFDITVDATASSAVFKINGTTVATISNNIPTGTNRTGVLVSKRKTNGTSLRQSRLDYLYFSQDVSR